MRKKVFLLNSTQRKVIVLAYRWEVLLETEKEKCCQIVPFKDCMCLITSKVKPGVCLPFLIGWGCSGVSNKAELTVEFLLSDWLEATQVSGFVLIRIFETFTCEEEI